jgi:hypothetical protein
MATQILRYETEAMAEVRRICTADPIISDNDVDAFKKVLAHLQRNGFKLTGPAS